MVHNGSIDSSLDSTISATDTVALSSDGFRIAALCIIPLLDLYGIIGNTFVCIAVVRFPNLRTVGNFYILSLAIADLLVCTVVMPLSIYQEVTNGVWRLPVWLCDLWTSLDVLLSTASIWLLCVISLDRYFAITKPHSYATKRTWECHIQGVVFKILTWLGWCNSILNPLIYTIFNGEFRKAFKKIISLKY
ncbi:D(1A) dopamine receptor-like [Amphiura filiformis]|uniref:D(1A) dopamine receptor-like n=1 Tax=Amphiura filiformis TaxID=82378 RepID=UPI003B20D949